MSGQVLHRLVDGIGVGCDQVGLSQEKSAHAVADEDDFFEGAVDLELLVDDGGKLSC